MSWSWRGSLIFLRGLSEYYEENPDPGLELVFRGEEPSWKLGKEHDYCMKDGVYVGQDYETDYDMMGSPVLGRKR